MVGLAALPRHPDRGLATGRQQTAQDFNIDARFGRNEMLLEQVAPAEREEYALHHRAWGTEVRVADVEIAGMKSHGDKDVDVVVRVAWYRPEQQELRSTTLKQRGTPKGTGWQLVAEKRVDGDIGLLGEAVVIEAPDGAAGAGAVSDGPPERRRPRRRTEPCGSGALLRRRARRCDAVAAAARRRGGRAAAPSGRGGLRALLRARPSSARPRGARPCARPSGA